MSIKYTEFYLSIHGLDIRDQESLDFLQSGIREAVREWLIGHQREGLKFRNEFDDDIEVDLNETAGTITPHDAIDVKENNDGGIQTR